MAPRSFVPMALEIMDKVMKHPAALPFCVELIPGETCPADYNEVIKSPTDLKKVYKKLKQRRYKTVDDWHEAVKQIWENAKEYYDPEDLIITICEEVEAIFENEYRAATLQSDVKEWWEEINVLRLKLNYLSNHPPREYVQKYTGILEDKGVNEQLFTEREIKLFIEAVKLLKKQQDIEALIKLIADSQPELATDCLNIEIDIYKLNPLTFSKAYEFVKDVLEKSGIPYPKKKLGN